MARDVPVEAHIEVEGVLRRQQIDQGEAVPLNRDQHPVGAGRARVPLRGGLELLQHRAHGLRKIFGHLHRASSDVSQRFHGLLKVGKI